MVIAGSCPQQSPNMSALYRELETNRNLGLKSKYLFEVGGKGKGFKQIAGVQDSYVVNDNVEIGIGNKIPLWLLGFLY